MAPTRTNTDRLSPRRVQWHDHDGQVIIHDPNTSLALNPTAGMLWRRLVKGADRASLIAALVEEFDIDVITASGDVDAFLAGLAEHGLLAEAV